MVIQVFPRRLYFRPSVYLPPAHEIVALFSFFLFIYLFLSPSLSHFRGNSLEYLALENKVNKYKRGHYQIMAWLLTAIHFTTYVTRLAAWRPWIYRRLNALSRESCAPAQRCSALIRFENAPQFTRARSRTSPFLLGACWPRLVVVGWQERLKWAGIIETSPFLAPVFNGCPTCSRWAWGGTNWGGCYILARKVYNTCRILKEYFVFISWGSFSHVLQFFLE